MNLVFDSTKVNDLLFIILTHRTKFRYVLCDWSFQVLGEITMDEGLRISKRLSLGMLEAPQDNIQEVSSN